jgi:hypothetical protein
MPLYCPLNDRVGFSSVDVLIREVACPAEAFAR